MTVNTAALATRVQGAPAPVPTKVTVASILRDDKIKAKFEQLLGSKAPGFMSSILNITNSNPALQKCEPMSVVSAAAIAAALDLPIDPNLGFAYVIPYGNKAQFQLGWKAFVQLAMRTAAYKTINACEVYEGELHTVDRFRGIYEFNERTSDKIVGYISYFGLINGFEKFLYMGIDDVRAHAKKYSKNYGRSNSVWQTDFDAMALKTVLKRLLSRFGILSIEMQLGIQADQAAVQIGETDEFGFDYVDNDGSDPIDAEFRQVDDDGVGVEMTDSDKALFGAN